MKITKEIIKKFLEETLSDDCEEFDEFEADYEFDFGEITGTCSQVRCCYFKVEVNDFEIEIDESDDSIIVSGNAYANYTVKGSDWDGDEEDGGYLECAEGDSGADFSFSIDVNITDFDKSDLAIDVD